MPTETRINVPFIPQEGITSQILAAIQLANETHARQQQLALQGGQLGLEQQRVSMEQAAQPSLLAQRAAAIAQTQAETEAIPKRLAMQQQEIEANYELRKVMEQNQLLYQQGMLGIRAADIERKKVRDAQQNALGMVENNIRQQLADARTQGTAGMLAFHNKALAQQKELMEQGLQLKEEANQLRKQGNEIAAEGRENQADAVIQSAGFWRTAAGELGLAEPVRTPSAATPKNPKAPAAAPGVFQYDLQGNRIQAP